MGHLRLNEQAGSFKKKFGSMAIAIVMEGNAANSFSLVDTVHRVQLEHFAVYYIAPDVEC